MILRFPNDLIGKYLFNRRRSSQTPVERLAHLASFAFDKLLLSKKKTKQHTCQSPGFAPPRTNASPSPPARQILRSRPRQRLRETFPLLPGPRFKYTRLPCPLPRRRLGSVSSLPFTASPAASLNEPNVMPLPPKPASLAVSATVLSPPPLTSPATSPNEPNVNTGYPSSALAFSTSLCLN